MITVEKPKVASHRAYVLKTSRLTAAVSRLELMADIILRYWTPQAGSSIFEAEWWIRNERRDAAVYVRAGSLPLADVGAARRELERYVLPEFARWLDALTRLPTGSPVLTSKPRFEAHYDAGAIRVVATSL